MSKRSSLMEAAKQNKKKTAIIAVVVVLVLAALFMRFKGGSKGGSGGGPGGPGGMQDTQIDNVATVAAENPKSGTIERTTQHIRYCRGIGRCLCLCEGIRRCDGCQRQRR